MGLAFKIYHKLIQRYKSAIQKNKTNKQKNKQTKKQTNKQNKNITGFLGGLISSSFAGSENQYMATTFQLTF